MYYLCNCYCAVIFFSGNWQWSFAHCCWICFHGISWRWFRWRWWNWARWRIWVRNERSAILIFLLRQWVPLKWLSDSAFQLVKKVWGKLFKNREYGAPETTLHLSWSINRISPASLHNEFLGIFARVLYGILLFTESSITLSRIKYHVEQNQVRASVWKARLQRSALCKFVWTN